MHVIKNRDLCEAIKKIYQDTPKPVYLSTLGTLLRKEGYTFDSIKEVVNNMSGYCVVQHPHKLEKLAIASSEDQENIKKIISQERLDDEILKFLSTLPRAFILAFCNDSENSSYISMTPPIRFTSSKDEICNIEISKKYKVNLFLPKDLNCIKDPEKTKQLIDSMKSWSETYNINIDNIRKKASNPQQELWKKFIPKDVALFIENQPESVKKNLVIPLEWLRNRML